MAFSFKDYRSSSAINVENKIYDLNNDGEYIESQKILLFFLQQDKMSFEDKYYGFLYSSYLYKRLFDYDMVLNCLDSAEAIISKTCDPKYFEINLECQRCFAYFDIQDYDLAYNLMNDIEPFVHEQLSDEDRAIYYMQQGYISYLKGKYTLAEKGLFSSEKIMLKSGGRHLPIVYTKLMEVYAKMDQDSLVNYYMEKSLEKAKAHGIEKYQMLTLEVRKNIAEEELDFETYLKYDVLFNKAEEAYNSKNHLLEIAEIKKIHDLKLNEVQLDEVKKSNTRLIILLTTSLLGLFIVLFLGRKIYKLKEKEKLRNQELKTLDNLNKEIFSIISHDLREPLVSINFFLDQLESNNEDKELMQDLKTQVGNTSNTLHDLLTWSASELAVLNRSHEATDLNSIVSSVLESIGEIAKKKSIHILNEIPSGTIWEISPWILNITVRNLLSNALKFSPNGEVVRITLENDEISIIDNGVGLPTGFDLTNFESRKQSNYGTEGENGFGIGIYLCQVLLKKDGFCIQAKHNSPNGAIFNILKNTP